jgi:secreted Zn-dependent insulinase-like peptidase
MGHEGPNSLTSLLVDEGLIEALECGDNDLMLQTCVVELRLELTREGMDQIDKITAIVF